MVKTSASICILLMFSGQYIYAQPTSSDNVLKKFDKNHDDRISFSEAPNHIQETFHIHDINRDGYISGTELSTMSSKPTTHSRPKHPSGNRPPRPPHPPRRPPR